MCHEIDLSPAAVSGKFLTGMYLSKSQWGGEGLCLYINKVLVVEIVSTGSSSQVCHKIDLSPAAVSGKFLTGMYLSKSQWGGEGLCLYINKVLVVEIVSTGSSSQVCHKIDLSPAAVSGKFLTGMYLSKSQ